MKTKQEALIHGRICKALLGKGWRIEARRNNQLSEGDKWHVSLSKGPFSVKVEEHGGDPDRYWCMVSHYPDLPGCGNPEWTPVKQRTFWSPRAAVHAAAVPVFKVVKRYNEVARRCANILEGL